MNKHILLVMKWLNDKDSVSREELAKNKRGAWTDYASAGHVLTGGYHAAYYATDTTAGAYAAAYWVDKYFELSGEDRAQYERELNK
jgi:hypothetical protein